MLTEALRSILNDDKQGEWVQNNTHGHISLTWIATM